MTVKDRVHELVDVLDDADAELALHYLTRLTSRPSDTVSPAAFVIDEDDVIGPDDVLRLAKPMTADDPLWGIVGLIDVEDDGPTDVSSNKHKYLTEFYGELHER
jgi:hypothetical protein